MPRAHAIDKAALPTWGMTEASGLVRGLVHIARRHGFTLGLYGAALGGRGRDLDVVAFPWGDRASPDMAGLVRALAAELHGEVVEHVETPFARAFGILLTDGRLVDLQVPRTAVRRSA